MTRVRWQVASRRRKKRVLKRAKGQFGGRSKRYRQAKESVQKGMYYAYRDRKDRKRIFRDIWIMRINAACREVGLSYSKLMGGLKKANITINRKMLSELAIHDMKAFQEIAKVVKAA